VDRSSADAAQNSGRHAAQRASATGEIAVSLPINVIALAKAHGPSCRVLERWRAKFRRNGLGGDVPEADFWTGMFFRLPFRSFAIGIERRLPRQGFGHGVEITPVIWRANLAIARDCFTTSRILGDNPCSIQYICE
jgi:hypothetical protein